MCAVDDRQEGADRLGQADVGKTLADAPQLLIWLKRPPLSKGTAAVMSNAFASIRNARGNSLLETLSVRG